MGLWIRVIIFHFPCENYLHSLLPFTCFAGRTRVWNVLWILVVFNVDRFVSFDVVPWLFCCFKYWLSFVNGCACLNNYTEETAFSSCHCVIVAVDMLLIFYLCFSMNDIPASVCISCIPYRIYRVSQYLQIVYCYMLTTQAKTPYSIDVPMYRYLFSILYRRVLLINVLMNIQKKIHYTTCRI